MFLVPLLARFCVQKRTGVRLVHPRAKNRKRLPETYQADLPPDPDQKSPSLQITIIVRDESTTTKPDIPPSAFQLASVFRIAAVLHAAALFQIASFL
jgi:hypothetical protein